MTSKQVLVSPVQIPLDYRKAADRIDVVSSFIALRNSMNFTDLTFAGNNAVNPTLQRFASSVNAVSTNGIIYCLICRKLRET